AQHRRGARCPTDEHPSLFPTLMGDGEGEDRDRNEDAHAHVERVELPVEHVERAGREHGGGEYSRGRAGEPIAGIAGRYGAGEREERGPQASGPVVLAEELEEGGRRPVLQRRLLEIL